MENNILILEADNVAQLAQLNLQMYPQILVTLSAPDGAIPLSITQQLLTIQREQNLHIQLLVNPAHMPVPRIFWAWLLGKLTITVPDAPITILTSSHKELQPLVAIGAEERQSVRLLQVSMASPDNPEKKPDESVTVASLLVDTTADSAGTDADTATRNSHLPEVEPEEQQAQTTTMTLTDNTFTDLHAIEPVDKPSEIAEMIRQKEERQRKNELMINALMKKVTTLPYQVLESKPVSALMQEQEIGTEQYVELS